MQLAISIPRVMKSWYELPTRSAADMIKYSAYESHTAPKDLPDNGSSHLARSTFALIHWDHDAESSHTETSNPATKCNLVPFRGGGNLHNDPNIENEAPEGDRPFASKPVRYRSGDQGSNKSTGRKLPKVSD